jgi:hypothetical protein
MTANENVNVKINEEILAVITAAIAAMETRPGYRLVVRSMRQIPQTSPVWNTAGRLERLSRNLNA